MMGSIGEIGFSLKLENFENKNKMDKRSKGEKVKQPLFQFRYDVEQGRYVREIKDNMFIDNANKDPNFVNGELVPVNLSSSLVEYLTPRGDQPSIKGETKKISGTQPHC